MTLLAHGCMGKARTGGYGFKAVWRIGPPTGIPVWTRAIIVSRNGLHTSPPGLGSSDILMKHQPRLLVHTGATLLVRSSRQRTLFLCSRAGFQGVYSSPAP